MSYKIHEFYDVTTHEDLPPHLVEGLEVCIASAFGGGITEEDAREHMAGQQVLVAQPEDHESGLQVVHGFTSTSITSPAEVFSDSSLDTEKGAYFAGAAIASAAQGTGLYHQLNRRRLDFALAGGVDTIFTRTQNPRVQEGITSSVERLVEDGTITAYGLGRTVCRGAYGKMLTATKPTGRKLQFDELDYEQGDAYVITWRFQRNED